MYIAWCVWKLVWKVDRWAAKSKSTLSGAVARASPGLLPGDLCLAQLCTNTSYIKLLYASITTIIYIYASICNLSDEWIGATRICCMVCSRVEAQEQHLHRCPQDTLRWIHGKEFLPQMIVNDRRLCMVMIGYVVLFIQNMCTWYIMIPWMDQCWSWKVHKGSWRCRDVPYHQVIPSLLMFTGRHFVLDISARSSWQNAVPVSWKMAQGRPGE
jgi:hypothetical protein